IPKTGFGAAIGELVGNLSEPACVFNVETCELLEGNEPGLRLWGIEGGEPPVALDSAMPGLVHLRRVIARSEAASAAFAPLTFWTGRGPLSLQCSYRTLSLQGIRSAAIVTWPAAAAPVNDTTPAASLRPDGHALRASTQDGVSDIATFRQIARRISERPHVLDGGKGTAGFPPRLVSETSPSPTAADAHRPDRDVIAKLSHELRTPLAAVIALAEIMTEGHLGPLPNERYRGYIRDIRDSTRHALALIDSMLGRSSDTAQLEFVFTEINLNDAAEACVATIQPLADKAGLKLSTALVERLPNVIADRRCLTQILLNLLTNSVRYAGTGAEVSVRSGFELAGAVWLEVADTGPGIPADVIARTLGPHHATAESAGADRIGLGLPLSCQLARSNGARLEIESPPGKGARVRIVFAKDRAVPV
ncbi:MAG TPA: HAMP domain-containing sensor histidine kinase, partial [Hyphomicrobiaceae bacterium]|nr:HAMP domain-containing sensor histidine kinase [Hyphomicrobiaceae bacterium]